MPHNILLKDLSQMHKIILIIVLQFFSGFLVAEAETVSDENTAARVLSKQLYQNLEIKNPLNIKVRKLTRYGTKVSSEFAYNLLEKIEYELSREEYKKYFPSVGKMTMGVPRSLIEVLPNEDEDLQAQDAFLEGTYEEVSEKVYVRLRLVAEDGKSVSRGEVSLPVSKVKYDLSPKNKSIVQKTEKEASQTKNPQPSDFKIQLFLNRETIVEGDDLKIIFNSDTDCYLSLLYQDVNGDRYIIFPLKGQQKRKLKAGKFYDKITSKIEISCVDGCGEEVIWAFASDRPITLPKGYVKNLNGSPLRGYPKDVSIRVILEQFRSINHNEKKAEKRVYLTTHKKFRI